jgi:hypothetical protein
VGFLANRREQKRRQEAAERFLSTLLRPADADDVQWLGEIAGASRDVVERELAFAQRAIGLIVAERDALDDRTAADVAHAIDALVAREAEQRREQVVDWLDHWREYAEALAARGRHEPPLRRIARVLLRRVGVPDPLSPQLVRVVGIVTRDRHVANEALRDAFGTASLPEDRPPSAVWRERTGHG